MFRVYSHDTLWRWNVGPDRIRFTGDAQENVFARGVIETDRLHTDSCAAIRPGCWGTEPLASQGTAESLRRAAENTRMLSEMYVAFRTPRADWSLKPDFFMKRLRTYLLAYPVGGRTFTGPNAANIASQISLDFLTGFGSRAHYDQWAVQRMKHMTLEDAFQVEMDALQTEPLTALVLRELGLTEDVFRAPIEWRAGRACQPGTCRRACRGRRHRGISQWTTRRYLRLRPEISIPRTSTKPYISAIASWCWRRRPRTSWIREHPDEARGIVVLQSPVKKGRRSYKTIRIPQSVLERVYRRLQR